MSLRVRFALAILLLNALLFAVSDSVTELPVSRNFAAPPVLDETNLTKNLTIEADNVVYLDKNQFVEATGNVLIVYRDLRVTANVTTINMNTEQMDISSGFVLNRSQQAITGDQLHYDFKQKEGQATSVNMRLMNKNIKGKTVTIKNDVIVIKEAKQTTCPNFDHPCNLITSEKLSIYPEWGDIVHDHAVVYFFFIPVMYVPNYVSDVNGKNDLMYSAIPNFGYNPVEGNFAKAGISYYTNEKLNGTIDIHYLSRLGLRAGFTDNYKIDQANRGQVRLHYLTGLGGRMSYGWQHRTLLGVPYKAKQEIIDEFFKGIMPPSNSTYPEFVFDLSSREMVGYQWVSYKPKLAIYSPDYELFFPELYHSVSAYLVDLYEEDIQYLPGVSFAEGNREYVQTYWDYNIYRPFEFGSWGRLVPGVKYTKSAYYSGGDLAGAWKRLYYNVNYYKSWDKFGFDAGYKYTLSESGYSLFNSESFLAGTAEENNFGLSYQLWDNLKLAYSQYYSISEHKLRDQVYSAVFKLCCWNVSLGWSAYLSQFTFGISLD